MIFLCQECFKKIEGDTEVLTICMIGDRECDDCGKMVQAGLEKAYFMKDKEQAH